jgi:asparagine synthase (glutamine-hydrolysing)
VRSAIGNYLVAELASEHVPFVLSGEGGDELFAGYAYQKDCESEIELTLSVQNAIAALHNTALQRVDRSAAAHGTRVGLPFLDPRVVRFALAIPSRWKIRGPQEVEKWPLRKALEDELPSEVIWRGKSKFWEGSGTTDLIARHAETDISDISFANERELEDGSILRSKEELLYYRIFTKHFSDKVPIEEIGRTKHI